MCGIAGWLTTSGPSVTDPGATLEEMTGTIRHRGPDDGGRWHDEETGIALGHRRLAILDLTAAGHQPMHSGSSRFVVVFNGEIYNFRELRAELVRCGHHFRGTSDTEVLLAAVEQWGVEAAVRRFNGMFALALWDRYRRELHLVRDRAGEKPLYFGWFGGTVVFGSELKALRAHPRFRGDVDRGALALFLRLGYVPAPYTIFSGVRKVVPGTIVRIGSQAPHDEKTIEYWSPRALVERAAADPFAGTPDEAVSRLDALLRDAIRLRMEADVPLGAFLSGGVDSSTIVALMQALSDRPVKTFTMGFHEARYDESGDAAAVARHLGTDHTAMYVTPEDALAVIPRLPVLYDEPFADASQIPTFLVSELTRRHVTVSLSGDAGDELFGGYRRYALGAALWSRINRVPRGMRLKAAAMLGHPRLAEGSGCWKALDPVCRRLTGKRPLSERARQAADMLPIGSVPALHHYMMSFWKDPSVLIPEAPEPLVAATDPARWADRSRGVAAEMMYLDFVTYLPDDILVKMDRASMGVSLEARIPLLDHRLIEFAWSLPASVKRRNGVSKWPLRELLYRHVPRHLVDRPKRGFAVPIAAWLRGPLRDWADDLLDERRLRDEGLLDPAPIRRKWAEHLSGRTNADYALWAVLMFQAWSAESSGRPSSCRAPTGRVLEPVSS